MTLTDSIIDLADMKREVGIVSKLHENDFYLPSECIQSAKAQILSTLVLVSIFHLLTFMLLRQSNETKDRAKLLSYQLANFAVNIFLGIYGFYFWVSYIPGMQDVSTSDKVDGFPNDITIFANVQIGYNLWAIPVGLFIVDERKIMIVHHVAVICVASISTFVTNGFRYYTPFFYGVIEMSSIPLTLMNILKENKDWQASYPTINLLTRLIFALAFLSIRVILWLPLIYDYLKHISLVLITSDEYTEIMIFASMCISAIVLTYLQMFWAFLIVKGLVGHFSKYPENDKTD